MRVYTLLSLGLLIKRLVASLVMTSQQHQCNRLEICVTVSTVTKTTGKITEFHDKISVGKLTAEAVDILSTPCKTHAKGTVYAFYVTRRWSYCEPIEGNPDQTCNGTRSRYIDFLNETNWSRINRTKEWEYCLITNEVVDGGYTEWTSWTDCSNDCNGKTTKQRYCINPTPCNGGSDCTDIGADTLVKDCGPQDGEWNSWGPWSSCQLSHGAYYYGTGTYTRKRFCNYTLPLCGGEDCVGADTDTGNCRNVPPCLTPSTLDEKFLEPDSPMVIYASANVEFYPLTQSECDHVVLYNYWNFYHIDPVTGNETLIKGYWYSLKFKIQAEEYDVGLYRLYIKIGYPQTLQNWMDESMYIQILHAPPHAFIRGGSGRTIGVGSVDFDARSVSYSLSRRSGDPSGLSFLWKCMNFVTSSIYKLMQLSFEPSTAFNQTIEEEEKWYDTGFTVFVENEVPWIQASNLYQRHLFYKGNNSVCLTADEIYARVYPSNITDASEYELVPLTDFYNITYLSDIQFGTVLRRRTDDIYPHPSYNTRIKNELLTFLSHCYGDGLFVKDTDDFYTRLSNSRLTLEGLLPLQDFQAILVSTGQSFFDNLANWLDTAQIALDISEQLLNTLIKFNDYVEHIKGGIDITHVIGVDMYLHLAIDSSGSCLLNFLDDIMDGMVALNLHDWYDLKLKDKFYDNWIQTELYKATECSDFKGSSDGTANISVTPADVQQGLGYIVIVQVSYEGSVAYFTQYAQSVTGQPLLIDIECRLNCMKKTAITATMSLRSTCPYCSGGQLRGAKFYWEVKHFDISTRTASNNTNWKNWMLTDIDSRKFVMKPNVLTENTGYLIEAYLKLENGDIFFSIWSVVTNMLPYGGKCSARKWHKDNYMIKVHDWKDEGFRSIKNPSLDWKEQINYRIVQKLGGEEKLLYYGAEQTNFITPLPGLESDGYETTVAVQIFDIFVDFTECLLFPGKERPAYRDDDTVSVAAYLTSTALTIDYHQESDNAKQVAMVAEVAGTSVHNLTIPETIRQMDPYYWVNIGTETLSDGTVVNVTFEELWDQLENPYTGDEEANEQIMTTLNSFIEILNASSEDADSTSTVNINQLVNSIATNIANTQFVSNQTVTIALEASVKLQEMLVSLANNQTYPKYEDYLEVSKATLKVLNSVLEGLLPPAWADTPTDTDIDSIMSILDDRSGVMSAGMASNLTKLERAFIVSEIASKNKMETELRNEIVQVQVPKLMQGISYLSSIMEMLNYRSQLKMELMTGNITTSQDKTFVDELVSKGVQQGDASLSFNYTSTSSTGEQNIKLTTYAINPYSWNTESKYITSQTVNVKVEDEDNANSPVVVSKVTIRNDVNKLSFKTVQIAIPDEKESFSSEFVYKMYLNNPDDSLLLFLENIITYASHTVFISLNPNPSGSNCIWKKYLDPSEVGVGIVKVRIQESLCSSPCLIYVGVQMSSDGQTKGSQTGRRRRSATVSNQTTIIDYIVTGITTGCRVWNNNTETWDREACKVSSLSTVDDTVCECTDPPGEDFATTFYVPPNLIDFGSVFDKFDLKNNAAVFATVISLLLLYALINFWAYRQDKKDPNRWAISYLQDNSPYDEYLYLITVYTGIKRNAGTSSNVYIHIIDGKLKQCTTRARLLDDGEQKGFGVGSIRRFIMTTPACISDPTVLKVWHDNSGSGNNASWYLNKITLEDLKNGHSFTFMCNQWLSLDRGEDNIERILLVSNNDDVKSFSNTFSNHSRDNMTDSYLWLSVAVRPKEDNFTRVQRLACCLTLLFLTMITSAMFYGQETGNKISLGPLSFTVSGIYISFASALISAPLVLFITYIFRNSKTRTQNKSLIVDSKMPHLPYRTIFLAWGLIIVAVLLSGFFLILYSMEWGKTKSEEWLLSFFFSFLETTILIDPLKVIVISIVLSLICKKSSEADSSNNLDYKEIVNEARRRSLASPRTGKIFVNSLTSATPLEEQEVVKLRNTRKEILKSKRIVAEIILYLIFLTIVYVISFNNRDPRWFYFKNHIEQHLIKSPYSLNTDQRTMFSQITNAEQLYTFISGTLFPFLFPLQSFSGAGLDVNERQFVSDILNFRVGPLRLRQLRIETESCSLSRYNITSQCYSEYDIIDNDNRDYCVGWKDIPCPQWESVEQISSAAWKSTSATDVWGIPIWGQHSTYAGGGYIADMSVNLQISQQKLDNLKQNNWIDRGTRAVFIEFTLYNSDDNVFLYTTLLIEFPETGGVITTPTFKPFRPYQHIGGMGVFVFICEIIIVIGIVTMMIKKVFYFRRHGRAAFKNVWNVLDLIIVTFFFICIVTYVGRGVMISYAMDKFKKSKLSFVNFQHIVVWDDLFSIFLGGIVFCITFRIMRVLQFSERISHMGYIFSYVSRDIRGCLLMFLLIYSAFVMFGFLIFGRQLNTYRNIFVSATTLTNAIVGKNSINDLFVASPVLGRLYYFGFVFFLLWVVMTMLNAALNVGITDANTSFVHRSSAVALQTHLWNMVKDAIRTLVPVKASPKGEPINKSVLKTNPSVKRNSLVTVSI